VSRVPFDTVLVANRGEIAVRVIRTLRRLGIRAVAVHSRADADARHVREADTAVLLGDGPLSETYLDVAGVVAAAIRSGAQAVHPGYGFLAENPDFVTALETAGVTFVGPSARSMAIMGDKIRAREAVAAHGVPVVPGVSRPGLSDEDLVAEAADLGYPVMVKPSAGGGGKGMRAVDRADGLPAALSAARREAKAAFGDDSVLLERLVARARHVEVQILADGRGGVLHLGDRECSLQRRHQKVIEEAPAPALSSSARRAMAEAAVAAARSVDYRGVGTVEFIVSGERPDEFFFIEMNTRLQVEHPVTELITGLDLVEWQIRVAQGEALGFGQDDVRFDGHAVEARVYAEDPRRGFLPTGGLVVDLVEPDLPGVRVDSGVQPGTVVGPQYDPLLAKVVAHAPDREAALVLLGRALGGTSVLGVVTNLDVCRAVLAHPDVVAGRLDTGLLDRLVHATATPPVPDDAFLAGALRRWSAGWVPGAQLWDAPSGWRLGEPAWTVYRLTGGSRTETVRVSGVPPSARVQVGDGPVLIVELEREGARLAVTADGLRTRVRVAEHDGRIWVDDASVTHVLADAPVPLGGSVPVTARREISSPMPGTVIAVPAADGARVDAGSPLVVVEAMKMEHTLPAALAGTVELLVSVGDQVRLDQVVARVVPTPDPDGGTT
jgi:acetyl-CoA/propionyl-CoA carboxylase biotin carboxyl carrier protein